MIQMSFLGRLFGKKDEVKRGEGPKIFAEENVDEYPDRNAAELAKFDKFFSPAESELGIIEKLDDLSAYPEEALVTKIRILKNVVHVGAVQTFAATMSNELAAMDEDMDEEERQWMIKFLEKWHNNPVVQNMDEEIYASFLEDLNRFSIDHPNFLIANVTVISFYTGKVWEPIFTPYYNKAIKLAKRFEYLLKKKKSIYQVYCDTDFVAMDPYEFESFIASLFQKMGYTTEVTSKSCDYGVDIIAKNAVEIIAIQVKKYSSGNNVSNVDVQRILGAMNYKDYSADRAILITTSDFTKMAIEQARGNPIELWNNAKLKREIAKYLINTIK
jgi:hypothetical protein